MNPSLLLSWHQYRQKRISIPYIYRIKKGNQLLLYFGADHVFNVTHVQVQEIRNCWEEFLKKTKKKNCLVLTEGGKRIISDNLEQDIREGGEGDFITHLAKEAGIDTESPEISWGDSIRQLSKQFPREEVYYMHFILVVLKWHKLKPRPEFAEYISHYLDQDKETLSWKNFDFSLEHMKAIHKRLFRKKLVVPDEKFFYSIVAPPEYTCIINEISRAQDLIRDNYMVDEIVKYWNEGKNLFIVFGVGHAVVQEPALRKLLRRNGDV